VLSCLFLQFEVNNEKVQKCKYEMALHDNKKIQNLASQQC